MGEIWALCAGVNAYDDRPQPDGMVYPRLQGCAADARDLATLLQEQWHVPKDHIMLLTASAGSDGRVAEAPALLPTYRNLVASIQALLDRSRPGDQILIQYTGHGARVRTVYPELKGADGLDEGLVPVDITDPGGQYLRDVELHYLLQAMVAKKLGVTVVLDCCHSGGVSREIDRQARTLPQADLRARTHVSEVAAREALVLAWGSTRSVEAPASGWLEAEPNYTVLAACRANEFAYEYSPDGAERHGALSYWLHDTLRQGGAQVSYAMLHNRVWTKVHGAFGDQTPILQGAGERIFLSDAHAAGQAGIAVLAYDAPNHRVRLNAGAAHGVMPGVRFSLAPASPNAASVAVVEVSEVEAVHAWATFIGDEPAAGHLEGVRAVPAQVTQVKLQKRIALERIEPALGDAIAAALAADGSGFVALATADDGVDFKVRVTPARTFEVLDGVDAPVPNLTPPIGIAEPDAAPHLVRRLVHLAKFHNILALQMPDAEAQPKLQVVTLRGASEDSAARLQVKDGEALRLRMRNLQRPGAPNDPKRVLNITVLALSSDWSVSQVFPLGSAPAEIVDPVAAIDTGDFELFLPEGEQSSIERFKVFATRETTDFRWLELPPLDGPPALKAGARALITDPMEQLLAAFTAGSTGSRGTITVAAVPQQARGWITQDIEIRVEA